MVGRCGRIHQSTGLSSANNLLVIANLVMELGASRTLETGMAFGASTLALLSTLKEVPPGRGRHIAIDPFQRSDYDDCGVLAAERAGLGGLLEVQYEPSSIVLPRLLQHPARFDLIYVDGSHLFEDAFVDAYFAARLLRSGGVILFDDCADAHVAKVIRFIKSNLRHALEILDLSPWRPDEGRGWRYRIGKLAGRVQLVGFRQRGELSRPYGARLAPF
jgi:predicted O-methyltransferase YrrM